jgi:hypothetical protein
MKIDLHADEGMWLTDGTNYGKHVRLGENVSPDIFYEVIDAEYQEIKAQKEAEVEAQLAE